MGSAFNIPSKMGDPAATRAFQALLNSLNMDSFLERSFTVNIPGKRADTWGLDNYYKANDSNFQDWYVAGMANATALTTAKPAVDTFIAVPFVANSYTIEGIAFEVTTVSGANGKARVGLYSASKTSDGAFYPYALVKDCGEFAVSAATGAKALTGLALNLVEGDLYFLCYLCGTANPTIRAVAVGGASASLGLPSTLGAAPQIGYTVASTYSSVNGLPTQYPAGATAHKTAIPAISIHYRGNALPTRYLTVWSPAYPGFSLRRARILSSTGVPQQTTGPYFTISAAIRRGSSSSVLGTYSSQSNIISAGKPFSLTGAKDINRVLLADDILEVQYQQNGRPSQDLSGITVQFDTIFTGAV